MKDRLREIVNYKTHGKQKPFAEFVGWSPQYLTRLLHGGEFGLKPVLALLKALPEINARWLLLGEGTMLMDDRAGDLMRGTFNHIQAVLELERFVPVMDANELREYEKMITEENLSGFTKDVRAKWIERLHNNRSPINKVIKAQRKSEELCRQQTVKKS